MLHLIMPDAKTWHEGDLIHVAEIVNGRSARWGAICGASHGVHRKDVHGGRKRKPVNCLMCLGTLRRREREDLARRNQRRRP